MKKIALTLVAATAFVLGSCDTMTPEEKAQKLIEEDVKACLIKPETYEFASIQLDSCFSDNQQFNEKSFLFGMEIAKLYKDYKDKQREMEWAERAMAIYNIGGYYVSEYTKIEYKKAKESYDKAQRMLESAKGKILQLYEDNTDLFEALNGGKHEFTGWVAQFSYRAETAGGMKRMGQSLYFFDKDLTKITSKFTSDELAELNPEMLNDINYEFADDIQTIFADYAAEQQVETDSI